MDLRRIGMTTAAGVVGSILAWMLSEPFAPTARTGVRIEMFHFTLGTPFGLISGLLLGACVAGPIAYVLARSRGDAGYALRTAFAVALFAAVLTCGLDALVDWVQIRTYHLRPGSPADKLTALSFIAPWMLCIVPGGVAFAAMTGSPTGPRLRRALATGFVVCLSSFFLIRAFSPDALLVHTVREGHRPEYIANIPWDGMRLLSRWSIGLLAGLGAGLSYFGVRGLWIRRELPGGDVWVLPLEDGPNRIGRGDGFEVNLWDDVSVEPQHAVLECGRSPWRIRPEGNAAVFVNGQRIQRSSNVKTGDVIQVGAAVLRLTNRYAPEFDLPPTPVLASTPASLVDAQGGILPLPDGQYTVGRDMAASLAFPFDPSVSRRHAEMEVRNGIAEVWDLGSANGTTVNGVAIQTRTVLKPGDRVAFGNVALTFRPSA